MWDTDFGDEYTDRNPATPEEMDALYAELYGVTRTHLNADFLAAIPRDASILEVGCNQGTQLQLLERAGFTNLTGCDVNDHALDIAQEKGLEVCKGDGLSLPFDDDSSDMVFTSGVLIHIHPLILRPFIEEMARVARRWLWGLEYYSPDFPPQPIAYHGQLEAMWRADYPTIVGKTTGIRTFRQRVLKRADGYEDVMYLFDKGE